jgi:hypothetical protein
MPGIFLAAPEPDIFDRLRTDHSTRSIAERWPSGRRHQIANLAYWVTGTEGSNPSLSATQSVVLVHNLEVGRKSPRDATLMRLMRTGERASRTRFGEFLGFVSRRRKAGSLHGSSQIRSSIAFLKWRRSRL